MSAEWDLTHDFVLAAAVRSAVVSPCSDPTRQDVVCGWDAGGHNAFARNA